MLKNKINKMKRVCKNIYARENDYNASSPPRRTDFNLKL